MGLTCKEKAELTYKALQKRKIKRRKKLENDADYFQINAVRRCNKLSHCKTYR